MPKGIILFSVILPTYNRGYCVGKMIDSVLKQDFKNYELIVVDDGSTDGTVEMLKEKYGSADIRIVSQENRGVSSARNLGISLARGEYITFVDSDDCLLDGFFRDIYENILKYRADVYVYTGMCKKGDKISKVPLFWGDWDYGNGGVVCKNGEEFVKDFCLLGGNSWACAKVIKASIIRENKLKFEKDISYGEDMLFNLQSYLESEKIVAIPKEYYIYQISEVGLSRESLSSKKKVLDLLSAYKRLEKHLKYNPYFALNYLRHTRKWFLLSFFKHNLQTKKQIYNIYLQISDTPCHQIEKLEAFIARKNLLCALFVYKILHMVWIIRSKTLFFYFLVKSPFRIFKKMIAYWSK